MAERIVVEVSLPFVAALERPKLTTRGGFAREYDTEANRANKDAVRAAYRDSCEARYGRHPMAGSHVPVTLRVETYRPMPKSRPKRVGSEPDTYKPDADNEAKLVMDALNGVAWVDDAQVNRIIVCKHDRVRGIDPHMEVTVMFKEEDA